MLPVLIDLGGFQLHTYGALGALGFVVVAAVALRDARRRGWNTDRVVDVLFWTAVAGIAGARLLFVAQNPGTLGGPLSLLDLRSGGMVFYGATLGLPVGLWVIRRGGLPVGEAADLFARLLPLGHAFARVGCFGAGCCYGHEAHVPWAVTYTHELAVAPREVPLHPTQLYEAGGLLGLFLALTWLSRRKRFGGEIVLAYLAGYALLRVVTETFRGDADRYFVLATWLGEALSTSQAIGLGFLALVAVLWPRLARRGGSATA